MKTKNHAEREPQRRLTAEELDRALAMTLSGISGRALVRHLIAIWVVALGAVILMRFVAERLHGY